MSNKLLHYPVHTVPFTAADDISGGAALHTGNRYGVVTDDVADGVEGVIAHRGVFPITKKTKADAWDDGADIEAVDAVDGTFTIQAHNQGVTIGKAYGPTTANDSEAAVELMPELN